MPRKNKLYESLILSLINNSNTIDFDFLINTLMIPKVIINDIIQDMFSKGFIEIEEGYFIISSKVDKEELDIHDILVGSGEASNETNFDWRDIYIPPNLDYYFGNKSMGD